MIYLSRGIKCKYPKIGFSVRYAGRTFNLNNEEKIIWNRGRFSFAETKSPFDLEIVNRLEEIGLVETGENYDAVSRYRLLTHFTISTTKKHETRHRISNDELVVLIWLRYAGIRLTVAELIYLIEHHIEPTNNLLYDENKQALVERIYTVDTIADSVLESQMEMAKNRDMVVQIVMSLLKKKYLTLLRGNRDDKI